MEFSYYIFFFFFFKAFCNNLNYINSVGWMFMFNACASLILFIFIWSEVNCRFVTDIIWKIVILLLLLCIHRALQFGVVELIIIHICNNLNSAENYVKQR